MFKFKSEINEFVWIRIIYYFKYLTFLKKIFKYILITGYPSFNWPLSGPILKNMDPQLSKWSFSRPHNNTIFLSFAICSLILKANCFIFILFALYTFQYALWCAINFLNLNPEFKFEWLYSLAFDVAVCWFRYDDGLLGKILSLKLFCIFSNKNLNHTMKL